MTPKASQDVTRTYVELCEGVAPATLQQSLSTFLLALDLNGQAVFASWVWKMVDLAFASKGESYAQSTLDQYSALVFRADRDSMC